MQVLVWVGRIGWREWLEVIQFTNETQCQSYKTINWTINKSLHHLHSVYHRARSDSYMSTLDLKLYSAHVRRRLLVCVCVIYALKTSGARYVQYRFISLISTSELHGKYLIAQHIALVKI